MDSCFHTPQGKSAPGRILAPSSQGSAPSSDPSKAARGDHLPSYLGETKVSPKPGEVHEQILTSPLSPEWRISATPSTSKPPDEFLGLGV